MLYTVQKELSPEAIQQAGHSVRRLNEALQAKYDRQDDIAVVVWISDIHLHTELGYDTDKHFRFSTFTEHVDTRRQFKLALHEVTALDPVPELVIFGGDLTDCGRPEEMRTFGRLLGESGLPFPTMPLFGNHDNMASPIHPGIRAGWPDIRRDGWPDLNDPDELYYSFTRRGWKYIVLDTLWLSSYRMSARQRGWLEAELARLNQPALVLCHRHWLPVGSWLDQGSRFEDKEVWTMLDQCPFIQGVFSGHVHSPRLWQYRKKRYCTFPALAYGIGAHTGWGGIVLKNGQIADVFYKEIYGESFDFCAGEIRLQEGDHCFMQAELFENHPLCHPGYWPFRERRDERD